MAKVNLASKKTWKVIRVWYINAPTVVEAIEKTKNWKHKSVKAFLTNPKS